MSSLNNNLYRNDLEGLIETYAIDIPEEGNLQLPTPSLLSYYKDKKDRVIWINKDIEDNLFDEIKLILQFNREDEENNVPIEKRKPIKLMIHSYGGALDCAFAMVDVLNLSKTPVYGYNINACMSAGSLIFINTHKRYCMPLSTALFHAGSAAQAGDYNSLIAQTDNYKRNIAMLKKIIVEKTKISKQTLTKKFKGDWYLTADEQISYGVADEIITDMAQILGDTTSN